MTLPDSRPIDVWLLSDGKAGDVAQVEGVAAVLGERVPIRALRRILAPRHPFDWLAPFGPPDPRERPGREGGPLGPPLPDLVIGTGRRVVPALRAITSMADPRPTTAFQKHPRVPFGLADRVWVPAHDRPRPAPNLLVTVTGPHRFSASEIARLRAAPDRDGRAAPRPRLGVILGGPSKGTRFDGPDAARLLGAITARAAEAASVRVVGSRRTPSDWLDALRSALPRADVWDGTGDNPYPRILASADALFVTGDSHNMVSEALAFGAPVHVFRPPRLDPKLARFLDALASTGAIAEAGMPLETGPRAPIDATGGIADAVLAAHRQRRSAGGA